MLSFKDFINESVIDYKRASLNPQLFKDVSSYNPKLKDSVINEIKLRTKLISHIAPIKSIQIIGSSLTHQYVDDTDIDVNLVFDEVPEDTKKDLLRRIVEINGQVLTGTEHPINFYVVTSKEQKDAAIKRADAVYDLDTNRFIKKAKDDDIIDLNDYLDAFKFKIDKLDLLKGELFRDVIDYESLKKLDKGAAEDFSNLINSKIKELERGINEMIEIKDEATTDRKSIFARDLTKEEFIKYKAHNRLPQNVVYKLLEKYHYLSLINKLKEIIGDDKKLSKPEADKLSSVINIK